MAMMLVEEDEFRRYLAAFEETVLEMGNLIERLEGERPMIADELDALYDRLNDFLEYAVDLPAARRLKDQAKLSADGAERVSPAV